jgi:WD40 repeat protein
VKLDTKSFTVLDCSAAAPRTHCISVPSARRVVLSPDGSKLLAFSENSNSVRLIDTSKFGDETSPIQISGFDRPVWGAFSSDSSKAYILNCGPECGGSAASVQVLNFVSTLSQSTAGAPVPVATATMGLLSGNTLFVTGTPGGAMGPAAGRLTAFDVTSGTPVAISAASNIPISDGYHTHMALASNNKLFIGSRQCTNNPESATPTGCLTIFDTSSSKAVIDTAKDTRTGGSKGFVTGMSPVTNRNMVYVVAGGEIRVYDTTTSAESSKQISITGQAVDVKMIDQ